MSRLSRLVVALLCALAGPSVTPAEPPAGYVSETLANGLRVSILPDAHHPIVATQVWYHVGAANEDG